MATNHMEVHQQKAEPWRVTLADTGEETLTGGRLKRVASYLDGERAFCFTHGDGVSDIDISRSIEFHYDHGKLSTVTAVRPPGRYGAIELDGETVTGFIEKPRGDGGLINGGLCAFSHSARLDRRRQLKLGRPPMAELARKGQLEAFEHQGFWQPMDTLREKNLIEELWATGKAPWKVWD